MLLNRGMLVILTDINPDLEEEFNRWYDREHCIERVKIPGFIRSRRYVAYMGNPKYLTLYETQTFDVLDSNTYHKALSNQTKWSHRMLASFKNVQRQVTRITINVGMGMGGAAGLVRLRPKSGQENVLRYWLKTNALPAAINKDGIISAYLLESDTELSKPLSEFKSVPMDFRKVGDWFVIIEGTTPEAISLYCNEQFSPIAMAIIGTANTIETSIYRLMWELTRRELEATHMDAKTKQSCVQP